MPANGYYDVFVSYAHADVEGVRNIRAALEARGLSVWMDEGEIETFASIARAIEDGLARSKVLLAYFSHAYPRRRACQWELTTAFVAASRHGDPRDRILVVNPEVDAGHIQPVELRDTLLVTASAEVGAAVERRARRIDGALGAIHGVVSPRWHGRPGTGSARFVGRADALWAIHSALHAGEVGLITGAYPTGRAQVRGLGGIGKSLIAEEYALRFGSAYPGGIFWLAAPGDREAAPLGGAELEAERHERVAAVAVSLGLPTLGLPVDQLDAAIASAIERRAQPCLWIVDDFPAGLDAETFARWHAPHPLAKTLVTTRSREYGALATPIDLDPLDADESYELLVSRRPPITADDEAAARGLVADLGGHALAVDVAAAALATLVGLQSFAEHRRALAEASEDELELAATLADALPTGHERSIATTLERSIVGLGAEGRDFLRLAAVLARFPVPARLVAAVFEDADGLETGAARRRAALAFRQAEALSLATVSADGARSVHALVARTVRLRDRDPERLGALRRSLLRTMLNDLPRVEDARTHDELELLVTHARELAAVPSTPDEAEALGWVAHYDLVRGDYAAAEELYRRQWNVLRARRGDEDVTTLAALRDLAEAVWEQRDLPRARSMGTELLMRCRAALGDEHPLTLEAMDDLAVTLGAMFELEQARVLAEQALEGRRRLLGESHADTATSLATLAGIHQGAGDYRVECDLMERAVTVRLELYGEEHQLTLSAIGLLASALTRVGEVRHGRMLKERVVELRRKVLGDEHPDTLGAIGNLASDLDDAGETEQSKQLARHVHETMERVLGKSHARTLVALNNLALHYQNDGELERARDLQERHLALSTEALGAEHPDTLRSLRNLAWTLEREGATARARALLRDVSRRWTLVAGETHPSVLIAKTDLAWIARREGDLETAKSIYAEVVSQFQDRLGPRHPETLRTEQSLARVYCDLGNLTEARALTEAVLTDAADALGRDHEITVRSLWLLADIHRLLGAFEDARRFCERVVEVEERKRGPEHRFALIARDNLAVALEREDNFEAALIVGEKLAETCVRALGRDDPTTLIVMMNQARRHVVTGGWVRARRLQEEVLDSRLAALGDADPDTARAADDLATTLERLGDHPSAALLRAQFPSPRGA